MLIGRTGKEEVVCVFNGIFIAVWAVWSVGSFDVMEEFVQPYVTGV